ncbi:hypothetical protein K8R42_00445, partial [bacterium]|nr:hypothetical protein [bacterium]
MQFIKKVSKIFVLTIFTLSLTSFVGSAQSAEDDFVESKLIKLKKSSAVYEISSDGKKYVYPDKKTYDTWHDDFSQVEEVELDELDKYEDGGTITIQPGVRLITHQNTAKIYAVGDKGKIMHVPSEEVAQELFGEDWVTKVDDVDPGIFSTAYQNTGQEIAADNLPDGTLVSEEGSEELYLIKENKKRPIKTHAYGKNKLYKKIVTNVKKLDSRYNLGETVRMEEKKITNYIPIDDIEDQVVICHKPITSNSNNPQTIKVSRRALQAHLNHGDTLGECDNFDDPEPEDICDNVVVDVRSAAGGTAWQDLGLDISAHPTITRYKIQW